MITIQDFLKQKQINSLESIHFKENVLFHGINHYNLLKAFENDSKLEARTTQRYWNNGRYLKDNHPDYENSGWLYGWSTSRDKFLAGTFGGALLVLNKDTLKENFKISPLSWSYRISSGSGYYKKEREDFIISHKQPIPLGEKGLDYFHDYIDNIEDYNDYPEYLKKDSDEDMFMRFHRLHNTQPKHLDLKKHLKEFYLCADIFDIYNNNEKENPDYKKIIQHPLFKGFYSSDKNRIKRELSESHVYKKQRLKAF